MSTNAVWMFLCPLHPAFPPHSSSSEYSHGSPSQGQNCCPVTETPCAGQEGTILRLLSFLPQCHSSELCGFLPQLNHTFVLLH